MKLLSLFSGWKAWAALAALALVVCAGFAGKAFVDGALASEYARGKSDAYACGFRPLKKGERCAFADGRKLGVSETAAAYDASIAEDRAEAKRVQDDLATLKQRLADATAAARVKPRKAAADAQAISTSADPVGDWMRCLRPLYADAGETFDPARTAGDRSGPAGEPARENAVAAGADPIARTGALPDGMRAGAKPDTRLGVTPRERAWAAFSCKQGAALAEERARNDGWEAYFREFNARVAGYRHD